MTDDGWLCSEYQTSKQRSSHLPPDQAYMKPFIRLSSCLSGEGCPFASCVTSYHRGSRWMRACFADNSVLTFAASSQRCAEMHEGLESKCSSCFLARPRCYHTSSVSVKLVAVARTGAYYHSNTGLYCMSDTTVQIGPERGTTRDGM